MLMNAYKVIANIEKAKGTFCLRVEKPPVEIKAGQCFNVGIPGLGVNREYSMYSSANDPWLDFLIRDIDGGYISPRLHKLQPGDLVEVDGPYGEFCIPPNMGNKNNYIFIATGTGVAPFHSFVKTFPNLDYLLIHGMRHSDECYDSSDYEQGRYISCISRNELGRSQRVTDYLNELTIDPKASIYICGNRNMIVDVVSLLLSKGVDGDQITTEVFF